MSASAAVDTSSEQWMLACLARHICRLPSRAHRHVFLDLMRKKHTTEFMASIEQKVRDEWAVMHPQAARAKEQHVNA